MPQIKKLVEQSAIQLALFDERNLASIKSEDYPGERLIACLNPLLAAERKKNREELLQATEKELDKIVAASSRKAPPLKGEDKIGVRVGKVINKFNVEKNFIIEIQEKSF